nr:BrnT family toxin [Acidiferrobacter sp.]
MEITFDPAKDAANIAKHGVSLALASDLEWGDLLAQPDTRRDYGELRMIGYAPLGDRVFCVVFTDRCDQRAASSV